MLKMSAQRCIDTIRVLGADIVQNANSGHPGAPMGCAPIAHVLFSKVMRFDPKAPKWLGRDRFVLSNGHASALLYTMLHLTGYEGMTMDDLKVRAREGEMRRAPSALSPPSHLTHLSI